MLHETLMRDWDVMQDDEIELEGKMTAEMFLTDVLGVQSGWIFEAKALAARQRGDRMKECEMWVECRNDRGVDMAHDILMKHILPEAVVRHDVAQMELAYRVLTRIEDVGGASNWTSRGGLMLNYMRNIIHIPACNKLSVATIEQLRDLAAAVRRMSAAYERGSVVEKHAASVIADAVATEQRAHAIRGECVEGMVEDLDTLGCSRGVKIRIKEEYRMQMSNDMKASWRRFALSFPTYSASIARIENDAPATANV